MNGDLNLGLSAPSQKLSNPKLHCQLSLILLNRVLSKVQAPCKQAGCFQEVIATTIEKLFSKHVVPIKEAASAISYTKIKSQVFFSPFSHFVTDQAFSLKDVCGTAS